VRLVRHGVRKLIDDVTAVDCDAGEILDRGLQFDYRRPSEKLDCRWRIKAERERMLTRVSQDAERALAAVQRADGLHDDELIAAAHRLLRELIGQDFEIDEDGVPRLHRGTRSGRIISTIPSTQSTCGARVQGSSDYSACSHTATVPAGAATSAATRWPAPVLVDTG
jgi:hypothetical protein